MLTGQFDEKQLKEIVRAVGRLYIVRNPDAIVFEVEAIEAPVRE